VERKRRKPQEVLEAERLEKEEEERRLEEEEASAGGGGAFVGFEMHKSEEDRADAPEPRA